MSAEFERFEKAVMELRDAGVALRAAHVKRGLVRSLELGEGNLIDAFLQSIVEAVRERDAR